MNPASMLADPFGMMRSMMSQMDRLLGDFLGLGVPGEPADVESSICPGLRSPGREPRRRVSGIPRSRSRSRAAISRSARTCPE